MRAFTSLLAITAVVSSCVAHTLISKRDTPLKVELSHIKAAEVNAVITNTGNEVLKLLKYGNLMDKYPIQKLDIFKDGVEVQFTGILPNYITSDFPEDAFTTLTPGESFTSIINIPALYDVHGGDYTVSAAGVISYAAVDTNKIEGSIPYKSNVLELSLSDDDIKMAPRAAPSSLETRTTIQPGCTADQYNTLQAALRQCADTANLAANRANSGPSNAFQAFFKTNDEGIRKQVAARLWAIAAECSSAGSGKTKLFCLRPEPCPPEYVAVTNVVTSSVYMCPRYYAGFRLTRDCGNWQNQAEFLLHEFSHPGTVFSGGTADYAYGRDASKALPQDKALHNADSFTFFAKSVASNCDP